MQVLSLIHISHVAANVGVMPDGRNLIVESYAPTYSQYTVSPFTTQSAVGVYRDGENGMREYYKHDNPFPDKDEFRLIAETMEELIRGNLPGDQAPADVYKRQHFAATARSPAVRCTGTLQKQLF